MRPFEFVILAFLAANLVDSRVQQGYPLRRGQFVGADGLMDPNRSECRENSVVTFKRLVQQNEDEVTIAFDKCVATVHGLWKGSVPIVTGVEKDINTESESSNRLNYRMQDGWQDILQTTFKFVSDHYLILHDKEQRKYKVGGWNQAWLGCPQCLCLDGRLDAAAVSARDTPGEDTELQLMRGLFKYNVTVDKGGKTTVTPTVSMAEPLKNLYYRHTKEMDAAFTDHLSNRWIFRKFEVSGYLKVENLDKLAEEIAPKITEQYGYSTLKAQLLATIKEHNGYIDFGPMETPRWKEAGIQSLSEAFFYMSADKGKKVIYGFDRDKYFTVNYVAILRIATKEIIKAYKAKNPFEEGMKKATIAMIPDPKPEDTYSGLKSITELHAQWPQAVDAATALKSRRVLFFKDWTVYNVDFDSVVSGKFKETDISAVKTQVFDYFNCPDELYKAHGYETKKLFVEHFSQAIEDFGIEHNSTTVTPTSTPDSGSKGTSTSTTSAAGQGEGSSSKKSYTLPIIIAFVSTLIIGGLVTAAVIYVKSNKKKKESTRSFVSRGGKNRRGS